MGHKKTPIAAITAESTATAEATGASQEKASARTL
jgi:hypothetical protein